MAKGHRKHRRKHHKTRYQRGCGGPRLIDQTPGQIIGELANEAVNFGQAVAQGPLGVILYGAQKVFEVVGDVYHSMQDREKAKSSAANAIYNSRPDVIAMKQRNAEAQDNRAEQARVQAEQDKMVISDIGTKGLFWWKHNKERHPNESYAEFVSRYKKEKMGGGLRFV